MQRTFRVNVDGRFYAVAVEELAAQGLAAPVAAVAQVAPAVVTPPVVAPAGVTPPAAAVPAAAGSKWSPRSPEFINSIEVRIGQHITVGDKVAVLEAMKMKTDILSAFTGTVQRIAVKALENVDTGQVIMTIG